MGAEGFYSGKKILPNMEEIARKEKREAKEKKDEARNREREIRPLAMEWMAHNAKKIILFLAITHGMSFGWGKSTGSKIDKNATEEQIASVIENNQNLKDAKVEYTYLEKKPTDISGHDIIMSKVSLGTGAEANVSVELDRHGKLVELRLFGDSHKGTANVFVKPTKEGEMLVKETVYPFKNPAAGKTKVKDIKSGKEVAPADPYNK